MYRILDRRNTLVAFKDAISESGRKLSLMVSENQQRALESLLADIQGAKMSPRRKALYSLIFFLFLVILYWTCLWLVNSLVALKEALNGNQGRINVSISAANCKRTIDFTTGFHNHGELLLVVESTF